MALDRDSVYQGVDTRFLRPVYPDLGGARELETRALGNIAEAGVEMAREGTVRAATKQADATVAAYDRLTRLDENASNFEDVFLGADNETVRAGRDMLAQLQRETGSLAAAVAQGRVNSSVAQARLERIVMDKAQMFPGWENDIASAVSGHLKFDPRGFAARRILGLDAQQDKGGEKDIIEKARDQAVLDHTKAATAVGGAGVVNNAAEAYRGDVAGFIAEIAPYADLQQQANRASLLYEATKNNKANSDVHARTLINTANQSLVAMLNTQVGVHLRMARGMAPGADNAKAMAIGLEDARQYLIKLRSDYDSLMLGKLKDITPNNPNIAVELLDRDSWATERETFKAAVDDALKLLDPAAITDSQEASMNYLMLLKRADFFSKAPVVYAAASVFGVTATGIAIQNTRLATDVASQAANVMTGAPAYGQAMPTQDEIDAVVDVLSGRKPIGPWVDNQDDKPRALQNLDGGIIKIFEAYGNGKDKPANEAEAYKRAFEVYDKGAKGVGPDGKTALRANVYDNQRLFDTLTSDGVLKNASPDGRKYLIAKMRNESARSRAQLFAWYDNGGEGSFAYNLTEGKTVYINGQPSLLREVLVDGMTPNPNLFVLENGGTTVRPRKLQDVPRPGDYSTNPESQRKWAEAQRAQADAQEATQRWAQAYNAQMPWLKKLDERINKFSGK